MLSLRTIGNELQLGHELDSSDKYVAGKKEIDKKPDHELIERFSYNLAIQQY